MNTRWVTFDCFGTLVDWHTGFAQLLTPLAGPRTADLIQAYHPFERRLECESPHRLYREVLTTALAQAAVAVGIPLSEEAVHTLPDGWGSLPIFAEVEDMLASLRVMGCRLAVLTNCDDDLFARTQRTFRQPFDLVITAEQVGAYKPAARHFERFMELTGASQQDWVHVACSWYHDIAPARALGIQRVWLDRDRTGEDERTATVRVVSGADVIPAIQQIFARTS